MNKLVEFKIQSHDDRKNLTSILANNGYLVKVDIRKEHSYQLESEYYVEVYDDE